MKLRSASTLLFVGLAIAVPGLQAGPISGCTPDFTQCNIYENQSFVLPFLAISGDVVLFDPATFNILADFRISNDFFDTGGGTGLGQDTFLYSFRYKDIPVTFSDNAVGIFIGPAENGYFVTDYINDGTDYTLFIATPEPGTWGLLAVGIAMAALFHRSRASRRGKART